MQLETEHAIGQYAAKTELCVQHTASHVAAIILRSVQLSCLFYSNKGLGLCALLKRYSKQTETTPPPAFERSLRQSGFSSQRSAKLIIATAVH